MSTINKQQKLLYKRWIEQGKETISMDEILNEFGGL